MTYLTDDVKPGTSVAAKIRASRHRTMGHNRSGNIGLDEHTVRQRRVGGLVLLRGKGVQDGGVNSQRTDRGPSSGGGRRWGRINTSS